MTGLTDSHCHLDYFSEEEIVGVIDRATEAGVERLVTIGVRMGQGAVVRANAERFAQVWGTVGVHPHNAAEDPMPTVTEILALADHPKIIGIGESGLDYFYDKAPREVQQEGFRRHIRAARVAGLPLCIHARQADEDVARILAEERQDGDFAFLLHCFSSGEELAEKAVEMGGYISFSGILTFPKSENFRALAARLPRERLLVETDAPYLAPVPFRGKRCEPAHVAKTAAVLAGALAMGVREVAELTTGNFLRLFKKAA